MIGGWPGFGGWWQQGLTARVKLREGTSRTRRATALESRRKQRGLQSRFGRERSGNLNFPGAHWLSTCGPGSACNRRAGAEQAQRPKSLHRACALSGQEGRRRGDVVVKGACRLRYRVPPIYVLCAMYHVGTVHHRYVPALSCVHPSRCSTPGRRTLSFERGLATRRPSPAH
jgi:hypothetical protein